MNVIVKEKLRDFNRFTGDGLPNEPVGAPLPIGDPLSGPHHPKLKDFRDALTAAVDQAEAAAASVAPGTQVFDYRNYLLPADIALVQAGDVAAQDATRVTAAIRAMMDDVLTFIEGGMDRVAEVYASGSFAVNDELFTEAAADKIFGFTTASVGFMQVIHKGNPRFYAKGWPAATRVRSSGLYAEQGITDPVPTVMYRWEQSEKFGFSPDLGEWRFYGEMDIQTDPIGIMMRNINLFSGSKVVAEGFAQGGVHICDMNNSERDLRIVASRSGANITGAGGDGFLPSDVRVATVAAAGETTVTLKATDGGTYAGDFEFNANHVGNEVAVAGIGVDGQVFVAKIASVTNATTAVLDREAATDAAAALLSFTFMPVATTAASNQITVMPNMTLSLVGRYVGLIGAGSTLHPELGSPYVRVVSHNLTTGAVVLARPVRRTLARTALITGPCGYFGKDDDQAEADGNTPQSGHNNDVRVDMRTETRGDGYAAVSLFGQNILASQFNNCKWHGRGPTLPNFGANFAIMVLDNCKNFTSVASQLEYGGYSAEFGKVIATGTRTHVEFTACHLGDGTMSDSAALVYTNPEVAGIENCYVHFTSCLLNAPDWPNTNQVAYRNGPRGRKEHVAGSIKLRDGQMVEIDDVVAGLVVVSDTPTITFKDVNNDAAFRMSSNGGAFTVQYSAANDGTYQDGGFGWSAANGLYQIGPGAVPDIFPLNLSSGTFIPTLEIDEVEISTLGGSYTTQTGAWTRIGNRVNVRLEVRLLTKGTGTGTVMVKVPSVIRPIYDNEGLDAVLFTAFTGLTGTLFGSTVASGKDAIRLRDSNASGSTEITDANLTNTSRIVLSGSFFV